MVCRPECKNRNFKNIENTQEYIFMICIRKDCLKDKEQTIKDNIDIIHYMKIKKTLYNKRFQNKTYIALPPIPKGE